MFAANAAAKLREERKKEIKLDDRTWIARDASRAEKGGKKQLD